MCAENLAAPPHIHRRLADGREPDFFVAASRGIWSETARELALKPAWIPETETWHTVVGTKGGCLKRNAVGARQSAEVQLSTAASQLATCPQIPCRRCHPADVHPSTPRQTAAAAPHAPAAPPAPPPPNLPRSWRAACSAAASRRSARRGGRTRCRVRVLLYWRRLQQRVAWGQGKLRP